MSERLLRLRRRIGRYLLAGRAGGIWSEYAADALALADAVDCDFGRLARAQQQPDRVARDGPHVCHWYLPSFDHAFYGGLMTVFRVAAHLQRRHGVRQRFIICGDAPESRIRGMIAQTFGELADCEVLVLHSADAIAAIPAADFSVATLWTTAYVLLGIENTGYKFYFIQDFEPAFYPAGSTYAQAELTYRFGFYGIANTVSLRHMYETNYNGVAHHFTPCVDRSIFFPPSAERPASPIRLFYYARPGIPRNGFELAMTTLRRVKQRLGSGIEIVCAGADWQPSDFGLSGIVHNMGLLPYAETGVLYRSCHIGLTMMMTKHPSYLPLELMASGSLVVANDNPANRWLLRDGENCLLSPASAECLTQTLVRAAENYPAFSEIRARAGHEIESRHSNWDTTLDSIWEFMRMPSRSMGETVNLTCAES